MPKKPAPKDARKRTKKPGKIADLPAKSLKGKDAAAVKGGMLVSTPTIVPKFWDKASPTQIVVNQNLNLDKD